MQWQINDCTPIFSSMNSLIEVSRAVDTGEVDNTKQHVLPHASPPDDMSISVIPVETCSLMLA
jgi:hypothetical protein